MLPFIVRRFLGVVPVLFGVTLLLFVLLEALPGDPARMLTGYRSPSAQTLANLKERLHTDTPLSQRYVGYMVDLSRGDLGVSYRTGRPVAEIIGRTLPKSLSLAALALFLELLIGVPIGVAAALKRDSFFDKASLVTAAVLTAVPVFLIGLAFQLVFSVKLHWLPAAGSGSLSHYVLPALAPALIASAYLARVVRASVIEILNKDYIVAARANGLPELRVLFIHALKPALPTIVTVSGLHFGFLIGSAVATEAVFDWPGLGHRLFAAVLERDRPLVIGATLVMTMVFVLVNLAVDIFNAWVEPRARAGGAGID